MKRTHARPLGELLQEFYNEHPELRQKILEVRVVRAWGEVLGLSVSKATRSLYVRQGILYVSVDSSVLRNELMLNRAHLVEKLNECAGAAVIREIVVRQDVAYPTISLSVMMRVIFRSCGSVGIRSRN